MIYFPKGFEFGIPYDNLGLSGLTFNKRRICKEPIDFRYSFCR